MIGVAPATASLVDWGLAALGATVAVGVLLMIWHNHAMHKRTRQDVKDHLTRMSPRG